MIAAWMLYALVAGALVTVAAVALERIALAFKRPTRVVWIWAMTMTVVWPIAAYVIARGQPAASTAASDVAPGAIMTGVQNAAAVVVRASESALNVSADAIAIGVWGAITLTLLLRLALASAHLAQRRRAWTEVVIDSVPVKMSRDVGPAVVGLNPMDVVIPRWALALDAPLRALVLRHEDEHRRARDPHVLLAAAVLVALVPWNLALLWQVRRLRLSIELDCDARVLSAHPDRERYGALLIAIAQRRGTRASLLATAMSSPASNLSRRILAMRTQVTAVSRARLALYGLVVAASIATACAVDSPEVPPTGTASNGLRPGVAATGEPHAQVVPDSMRVTPDSVLDEAAVLRAKVTELEREIAVLRKGAKGSDTGDTVLLVEERPVAQDRGGPERELRRVRPIVEPGTIGERPLSASWEFNVDRQATMIPGTSAPKYPTTLRNANIQGSVLASFVVNADGTVDAGTFRVIKSSHALFTSAVRDALATMRFTPAMAAGRPVRHMIQQDFTFAIQ